ncbi:MAG: phospho-sugar mutase [Spirochaetales bacterium]|nr:phospho-sugar mutase [Spirochaetales bacterium]
MDQLELKKKAQSYLDRENNDFFRKELEEVLAKEDWAELEDRFYKELDFGTGGLRGVIGGGDNRLNTFNIHKATQGLANYISAQNIDNPGAVIAYDSRHFSDTFALDAALVLAANGIKTWLFSSLRPTPELSYAVRELGASVGIVVTASHNPPEYNGYKVYWADGGQLVPPHDKGVIAEVRKVTHDIRILDEKEALDSGMLEYIDTEIDESFIRLIKSYSIRPELIKEWGKKLKVVYTPLHGTGTMLIERIFGELGIQSITVPEQRDGDGDFPTVKSPNPEEASALKMALELGKKEKAQLVIGTDPDADRIGIAEPDGDDFRLFSGNQLGVLLGDYIFSSLKEKNALPKHPALVKTIVTTEMQTLLGEKYGARVFDVLTGFKYIGEKIKEFESDKYEYVFGGEESYGFLCMREVRDKDAISTAAMIAEMVLYHYSQGKTLADRLNELYIEFGMFQEILVSKTIKGPTGAVRIKEIMQGLRENPPATFGKVAVREILDYKEKNRKNLPPADVIQIILEDDTIITARPSGTEPKIKFYASARTAPGSDLAESRKDIDSRLNDIRNFLEELTA